jgi:hypothetical protein
MRLAACALAGDLLQDVVIRDLVPEFDNSAVQLLDSLGSSSESSLEMGKTGCLCFC